MSVLQASKFFKSICMQNQNLPYYMLIKASYFKTTLPTRTIKFSPNYTETKTMYERALRKITSQRAAAAWSVHGASPMVSGLLSASLGRNPRWNMFVRQTAALSHSNCNSAQNTAQHIRVN